MTTKHETRDDQFFQHFRQGFDWMPMGEAGVPRGRD